MHESPQKRRQLFEEAARLPLDQRAAYLDRHCGEDKKLREAVERLLQAHDESGILDRRGSAIKEVPADMWNSPSPFPDDFEKAGDSIGDYRLKRLLGEGGFGAVFLADQVGDLQRRVAVKVLKPGMDSRPVIARFEAERQALALMEHPGIAHVFDSGATAKGRPYFVMEYVDGSSITDYSDSHNLDLRARLALFEKVVRAVHHAHQKGVIHRDLKPSNIMVTESEGEAVPKVIDFGIAKALHTPLTDSTRLTRHGQIIGTPEYMSPEQARSSGEDVDIRTDVYSLGMVLYELLAGTGPFDPTPIGPTWLEQRQTEEPVRPSRRVAQLRDTSQKVAAARNTDVGSLRRRLEDELDWIVLKAISRDRTTRYESAAAFAADLRAYLQNRPVSANPPSTSYRLSKFVSRHRVAIGSISSVALAIVVGLAIAVAGFVQASRERDAARLARDEAEAVASFLAQALSSADPAERGRDLLVVDLIDESASRLGSSFPDKPVVRARLHHTIGSTYWALGRSKAAEEHLLMAVSLRQETLGSSSLDTLTSMASLGGVYFSQGRLKEAEDLYLQTLERLSSSVGDEHEQTLGVLNNLAQIYASTGRLEQAIEAQTRVSDAQERVLGPSHPHTLGSRLNLAQLRIQQGQSETGIQMLEEVSRDWRQAQGDDHPGTLMALQNLANAYASGDDPERGLKLGREVLERRRRVLGKTHRDTWNSQFNLAWMLLRMKQSDEAVDLLDEIVQSPPDGGSLRVRISAANQLLSTYESQGWPQRSQPIQRAAADLFRAVVSWPAATSSQLNTAAYYLMTLPNPTYRDNPAALAAAQRACDLERENNADGLWRYLDTLAYALHVNGNTTEAIRTQKEALELIPDGNEGSRAVMEAQLEEFQRAVR